jgi:hypothetical protein
MTITPRVLSAQLGPVFGVDPSFSSAHLCATMPTRPPVHERGAAVIGGWYGIQRGDVVLRLVLAVEGMKMRRGMIIP